MVNELKTICDLLDGYTDDKRYQVLAATKTQDGTWELTVKRVNKLECGELNVNQPGEVAEDANK